MALGQPGETEPGREAREDAVRRVLESRAFAKSSRLSALCAYICRHSLDGRTDELTEQQIGIHVFDRAPGYNSGEDTIVRGTARHLRQRIDTYYQQEGAADPVRITIPKGGYVAMFLTAGSTSGPTVAEPAAASDPALQDEPAARERKVAISAASNASPRRGSWPRSAKAACTVALALAIVLPLATYLLMRRQVAAPSRGTGPAALWHVLFQPGIQTLIVPGDAALDAFISFEQRPVTLEQYTEQSYQQAATAATNPRNGDASIGYRSITPMSALRIVANLVRVPNWIGIPAAEDRTELRYARDVSASDVSNTNLILIGSQTFNPWVTLYQQDIDFNVVWDFQKNIYTVTNRAPHAGEPPVFTFDPRKGPRGALTVVSLTENTQGRGRVLLVEGTTMGATYGGMRFLFEERLWAPVIAAATDRSGKLHDFDVLLRNDFVRGGVSNTTVAAVHVH